MSTREERVLGLAREAWRAGEPSQARVELAARRIERKMRARGHARPLRRHTQVLAFLVVFGGALAYAASGGAQSWFGQAPRPTDGSRLERAARAGLGREAETWRERARAGNEAAALDHGLTASGQPAVTPEAPAAAAVEPVVRGNTAKAATVPAPAASWRAVDEALDAKDDARAKQALEGLSRSNDATTRAKARLGLAQLARSKGDCATARRLADEVVGMAGVDPSVARRAQSLAAECK